MEYSDFLKTKQHKTLDCGINIDRQLIHSKLFEWQKNIVSWANGIWLGISESDTLQFTKARGIEDEKHICPLQLGTIERCIKLYSNPNEMVLTPFGGIGSEAYMALKLGRKATLIELKPEYYNVAIQNLKQAESYNKDLFSTLNTNI